MRLPDFVIIGAAKCGTSTLYHYLMRHPQVFMSTPKEPSFFAVDGMYGKGLEWYASLFEAATPDQVCGEASTNYTNYPFYQHSAERLASHLPRAKLIYLMREPVERAYSHYVQLIKNARARNPEHKVEETFEQAIQRSSRVLDASDYMLQIEQYLRFYQREAFLFLLLSDLRERPREALRRVCEFIGVDSEFDLVANNAVVSNQTQADAYWVVRSRLMEPILAIPGVKALAGLAPAGLRDWIYAGVRCLPYRNKVEAEYLPPQMVPETRELLRGRYMDMTNALEELLGRDLSEWRI